MRGACARVRVADKMSLAKPLPPLPAATKKEQMGTRPRADDGQAIGQNTRIALGTPLLRQGCPMIFSRCCPASDPSSTTLGGGGTAQEQEHIATGDEQGALFFFAR